MALCEERYKLLQEMKLERQEREAKVTKEKQKVQGNVLMDGKVKDYRQLEDLLIRSVMKSTQSKGS